MQTELFAKQAGWLERRYSDGHVKPFDRFAPHLFADQHAWLQRRLASSLRDLAALSDGQRSRCSLDRHIEHLRELGYWTSGAELREEPMSNSSKNDVMTVTWSPAGLTDEDGASVYLDVSAKILQRWRKANTGPCYVKLGGAILYAQTDLDAWIEACRVRTKMDKSLRSHRARGLMAA